MCLKRWHYESLLYVYACIEARLEDGAPPAVGAAIVSELATLQQAAVHLYWRLSLWDRLTLSSRRRAFHRGVRRAAYAQPDEARRMFRCRTAHSYGVYVLNRYVPPRLRSWVKGLRRG